jgi:tetratricopeptide (TPR) repeat protein
MELYRRALAIAPNRPEWRVRYARLLADAGRDNDALRELEQACRIGDNLPSPPPWLIEAHRLAGEVAMRTNRRDAARQHYRRFVELAPPATAGLDEAQRVLQE